MAFLICAGKNRPELGAQIFLALDLDAPIVGRVNENHFELIHDPIHYEILNLIKSQGFKSDLAWTL